MKVSVGILTVSDRCFKKVYRDKSGPALEKMVKRKGWSVQARGLVPDRAQDIKKMLTSWCDRKKILLVLTTGGTGIGSRDVTPEATVKILEKEMPGIPEMMRREGLRKMPLAALSRAVAGIRKKTLIINLPGNPQGAAESLNAVIGLIPHSLSILRGGNHAHHNGKKHDHS